MKSIAELIERVEEREEELICLLQQLVEYQTESPPARNTKEAQDFIAHYLADAGFDIDMWDVYPNDPNVVAVKKGTASAHHRSLLLNGHVDVASVAKDENWTYPPFKLTKEGRKVYGRGMADMKGGLAACLFAAKLLHEAGIELPGDLTIESVIGEEVGEAGTKECCDRGYRADFAVVADTSNCEIHGQGGVITGWVTVKSPKTFHDGLRRNMIHAGGGLYGASAIEKMTKLIQGLSELERHWAITKSYPGFPSGMNTINPAVIEGGRHAAFIADECSLWITVHYYPDETYQEVTREIEEHLLAVAAGDPWLKEHPPLFRWGGTSMIEDRGEIFPALPIDLEWDGLKLLESTHHKTFGVKTKVGMSSTVTDGGWLGDAGIPTVIYGPGELIHAHAVNEELSIDQLLDYTKTILTFIYEWCHKEKQ
ncbi:acetylornithine deacetylase [Alkalihalophilus pseudofirmus OF4]|uniref:Probable succinyl-diaminopimelate desuccinylase n=1 Tax=Alkalihalophilus pseudofirmus (strain ATCC BAA-2126 / JCM 17055 / OF4) TaxID=398511 RepID=D3FXH2_ALKPO|nr:MULTISPECIES: acetylornithine deacetylase [Alkalihalophilus]ADC50683.1 acetylornithine deacetylase [Alkalihalophilus pseudofirmus OF4]MED1602565.1 acetylornithine deacetylase [Alkalihalophilus marmarensis]